MIFHGGLGNTADPNPLMQKRWFVVGTGVESFTQEEFSEKPIFL